MRRESPIFRELNTKTIGDNPSTDIDLVSKAVHLQESNRTDLLELDLINRVTMRNGSPMPGTMTLHSATVTDNTFTPIVQVGKGEVLQVVSFGYQVSGLSGSATLTVFITPDPESGDATNQYGGNRIFYHSSSSETPALPSDSDYRQTATLSVCEDFQLGFTLGGSYTDATVRFITVRLR